MEIEGIENIDFSLNELDNSFDFSEMDFSTIEVNLPDEFETRYCKPAKSKERDDQHCFYSSAETLAESIEIGKQSKIFTIVNGTFIYGDFIEALITKKDYNVKRLVISTLSMSMNNIDSLANLINWGYVSQLDLIVSDYFFSHERRTLIPYCYEKLDVGNKFQLAAARTHCKTINIETECGLFITIHGSANLRSSGNLEQMMIEEDEELYKFNVEYQDRILQRFSTINKSLNTTKTWQAVALEQRSATD